MKITLTTLALTTAMATSAVAQELPAEVKARQGQFRIMAINLGILGSMAKGETEYSAEAAQAAADSLVGVSMVNQAPLWPAGTDAMSIDGTRALPAIWENLPDVLDKWSAFGTAAAELQTVAATGQEALGPMLGKLGGACKACHDTYREPQ
ncbi:c-type cytochrome [Thetidibacter halocola]|uniref:Cytochrome c n=1 Tax=Thetidibacter halocola TaxID=2827239 RepID=A0A8J7W8T0_9RHOB|nr:cytochrome c [Thetidibacter halocola]MBS0123007.1 cytochrome c [Thetidibacter halocola]